MVAFSSIIPVIFKKTRRHKGLDIYAQTNARFTLDRDLTIPIFVVISYHHDLSV